MDDDGDDDENEKRREELKEEEEDGRVKWWIGYKWNSFKKVELNLVHFYQQFMPTPPVSFLLALLIITIAISKLLDNEAHMIQQVDQLTPAKTKAKINTSISV